MQIRVSPYTNSAKKTDPPTNKPPFEPEQAAVLCAHSELRISSFHLFSEGKKTLFCINQHPCHKFNLHVNLLHVIITNSPVCTSAVKASSEHHSSMPSLSLPWRTIYCDPVVIIYSEPDTANTIWHIGVAAMLLSHRKPMPPNPLPVSASSVS